jgi:hypothetical protein
VGRLTRVLGLLAVNILVLACLAEVTALGFYYYQHGWLFYLNPYRETFALVGDAGDDRVTDMGVHPYFGPVHRAGLPVEIPAVMDAPGARGTAPTADRSANRPLGFATNNFGFASPHDFPYVKKDPREFVVGIFGGSVAAWFCQLGAPRLLDQLSQRPAFRGRTLVPLCFGHEGYKQPQQALLLTYFLLRGQRFDLVVNIDGLNEVALSALNDAQGLDVSMPSVMHLDGLRALIDGSTLTPAKLRSLTAIERHRQRMNAVAARLARTPFASVFVVLERYYRIVEARYQAERVRFAALPSAGAAGQSVLFVTPPLPRGETALFDEIAGVWLRGSTAMRDALAAQGVPYVHVLQPNQYASGRTFGAEEARIALNPASPFKRGAEQGYPRLTEALRTQGGTAGGVRIADATRAFDDEPAQVYVDDCCHYTARGNEILADVVLQAVRAQRPDW